MLPTIKSLLAGFTPASAQPIQPVPASHSDAVKAQVVQKHREMFRGKTEAQVNRLTTELAEAHRALEQARHTLGERMSDGLDTNMALDELARAESRVKILDATLTVATQRDDEAQRALTDAKREAEIEIDEELVAKAKASSMELETLLSGELKRCVDRHDADLLAVADRCPGDEGVASSLRDIRAWYPVYLDRTNAAMIPRGRTYSQVIDKEKKTLSSWIDKLGDAVAYRRKGR